MSFLSSFLEVLNIQQRIYLFNELQYHADRLEKGFLLHEVKMVERQGHTACFLLFGPVLCICRAECTHTIDKRTKLSRAGAIPLIRHEMEKLKFLTSLNIKGFHIFLSNICAVLLLLLFSFSCLSCEGFNYQVG